MRIGLIGPATADDEEALREAVEFLLGDAEAEVAVYLGDDDFADGLAKRLERELLRGDARDFLDRALDVACGGAPDEIQDFLERDRQLRRLGSLRTLPPAPARAVEIVGDRIVLMVHDKRILDEDDIANATMIIFGRSTELLLKRFGPRYFFSPGPLAGGKVGLLEAEDDGRIAVSAFAPTGEPLWREVLQGKRSKLSVSG
ncbi:MAG: hypothetical protein KF901_33575 [Myxococcales bacterium]|nr:hypothetical protein [Myxococcales bacterium]